MKDYKEMADSVFQRSNKLLAERAKRRKTINRVLCHAGCYCLVALIGFGVWKSGILDQTPLTLTDDSSSSEGDTSSLESTESSKNYSDNNSTSTSVPPNQSEQTEPQGNTSSKPSESNESHGNTTSGSNIGSESQTAPSSGDGDIHAVYLRIPVTYEEAQRLFGHSIVECSSEGFLGYEVGTVSPKGNINDNNTRYLSVIYLFQNGKIELTDQSRLGAGVHISYDFYPSEEYKGRTFWYDSATNNIYFPLSYNIIMTANFSNLELSEIYDLLLTLGGKNSFG